MILRTRPPLVEHYIQVNGRSKKQPRLSAFYGPTDYTFSGLTVKAQPISDLPLVNETDHFIKQSVENTHGIDLRSDSHVINYYKDGSASCGAHADDEPMVDSQSAIYCLSLGETRIMTIESKHANSSTLSIELKHGSLLIMREGFQQKFIHAIPKDLSRKGDRGSITWRNTCPLYLAANPPITPVESPYINGTPNIEKLNFPNHSAKKYVGARF